jgi:unsaturated pyranuronate lyase
MKRWSWGDIESERLNENIVRKMFWGEKIMVVRLDIEPNTTVPEHEHESEQITMVFQGSITLAFPDGEEVLLSEGEMLVIPPSLPHSARTGSERCKAMDFFSPIRQDFIEGTATYFRSDDGKEVGDDEVYRRLRSILAGSGIQATFDQVKEVPLDILARYVYEREMVTMGELRRAMGWDKREAKAALREWKHGDDHSQASLEKMRRSMVILPWDPIPPENT